MDKKEKNKPKPTDPAENALYHDTWKLLKNYRDVVWSVELSVSQARSQFQIEYGSSVEDFLDSLYLAGADISGSKLEHHAKCIERSQMMLKLVGTAVDLLRSKHKNGEVYYWILYYSYLSPQEYSCTDEIIENLSKNIKGISYRMYYRKRYEAIVALGSILWGYTSKECLSVIDSILPANADARVGSAPPLPPGASG